MFAHNSARWVRRLALLGAGGILGSLAILPAQTASSVPSAPVLVELFTSEGCSSCPPADIVLARLEHEQPVRGAQIIALGEHVDYWDHGGWADRYSSHAYSVRQSDYATHFHNDSVYTPQMIVDGRAEFVGSDSDKALQAITRAARALKANVQITRSPSAVNTVSLTVRVDHLPAISKGDMDQVLLAVTEGNLHTRVGGGENGGRTLAHTAVVRRMGLLGRADAHNADFTARISLLDGWQRENLRAVVFVQEAVSRRVVGAAEISLGG